MQNTAIQIVKKLQNKGFQAFFAGGCVRDLILKKEHEDIDIATNATPEEIENLFEKTYPIGKQFGVILIEENRHHFEIATFRSDSGFSDGRRPDFVTFSTAKEDALRRDFTINGIFYDPLKNEFYDFVEGKKDLKKGILRFIGNSSERIQEDHLRILRAVRFKNRFNLQYETETQKALKQYSELVNQVSPERIREELNKIIVQKNRKKSFEDLKKLGIFENILPEITDLESVEQPSDFHSEGNVLKHTFLVLDQLGKNENLELYWSALFHDMGKLKTFSKEKGQIHFYQHQDVGAEMVKKIGCRLKFSRKSIRKISWLVGHHHIFDQFYEMRLATRLKYYDHPFFKDLIKLHRADILGCIPEDLSLKSRKKTLEGLKIIEENYEYAHHSKILPSHKKEFFSGKEIMEILEIPSGEKVGEIKEKLREMQLEGELETKELALEFLKKLKKKYQARA